MRRSTAPCCPGTRSCRTRRRWCTSTPPSPGYARSSTARIRRWVHRFSVLVLAPGDPGQDEGDEDDRAVEEVRPLGGHPGQGQHINDHKKQQYARERAEHAALAAVEAHAADDRRREHLEDGPAALTGRHGGQ